MSSAAGVNVLRWSALGLGAFYGIYHQSSIRSSERTAAVDREYSHKAGLIEKARAEYVKKHKASSTTRDGGVITNPDDPKFDLEAYLTQKAAETS